MPLKRAQKNKESHFGQPEDWWRYFSCGVMSSSTASSLFALATCKHRYADVQSAQHAKSSNIALPYVLPSCQPFCSFEEPFGLGPHRICRVRIAG
ncbi:hypothetical protein CEXT_709281 [Caerostris extrusa]|uniref:Uncharacterized protein n=1 Tax=Caerostris extrusa TaxID=172846 RepID=A0AAV4MNL6_CAEEX|nr:hypothetical protein CEXT_709281 [Caerostris extrusa]